MLYWIAGRNCSGAGRLGRLCHRQGRTGTEFWPIAKECTQLVKWRRERTSVELPVGTLCLFQLRARRFFGSECLQDPVGRVPVFWWSLMRTVSPSKWLKGWGSSIEGESQ